MSEYKYDEKIKISFNFLSGPRRRARHGRWWACAHRGPTVGPPWVRRGPARAIRLPRPTAGLEMAGLPMSATGPRRATRARGGPAACPPEPAVAGPPKFFGGPAGGLVGIRACGRPAAGMQQARREPATFVQ